MERLGPDSVIPSITRKVAGPYRFHGFIEFLRGKVFLMFEFVPDVFAQSPNHQELADPVQTSSWSWEALIVTGLLVVIAAVMFWVLTRRKVSTPPPAPSLPKTEKRTPTTQVRTAICPGTACPRAAARGSGHPARQYRVLAGASQGGLEQDPPAVTRQHRPYAWHIKGLR
jgi:hypothetical protein